MLKKIIKIAIYPSLLLGVFFSTTAHAGSHPLVLKMMNAAGVKGAYNPGTHQETIATLIGTIIFWFLSLLGVIFMAFMIYAGYLWLTSRGNSERVEKAKDILKESIVGIGVVFSAAAISALIYLAFVPST